MEILLIVLGIISGLAAIDQFVGKRTVQRFIGWLRSGVSRAPSIPADASALSAYVHGNPHARALDKKIAEARDLQLQSSSSDFKYLEEKLRFLGIATIRELDALVKKHSGAAFMLSHYLRSDEVCSGFGLDIILEIHALESGGLDRLTGLCTSLKLSSASRGWAEEFAHDYKQVTRPSWIVKLKKRISVPRGKGGRARGGK